MGDILTTKVDTSNLVARTAIFSKALGISMAEGLEYQGGLLMKDLVAGSAPKNLSRAQRMAALDVKKLFYPKPLKTFSAGKRDGQGIKWLYAGKNGGRFLVGVNDADYQPQMDVAQMRKVYYESKNSPRGKAWVSLGQRGKQNPFHVQRINRIVVARGKLAAFTKAVRDRFGLQKAAWGVGWDVLKVRGVLLNWVRKHITKGAAKGVLVNGLANPGKPFLQLISRATGVERAASLKAIRAAVKKRHAAMNIDLKHYIAGAKDKAGFYKTRKAP